MRSSRAQPWVPILVVATGLLSACERRAQDGRTPSPTPPAPVEDVSPAPPAPDFDYPLSVERVTRVELTNPVTIWDSGEDLQTDRVLVLVLHLDNGLDFFGGHAAPDPIWLFNRSRIRSLSFSGDRAVALVPDPGDELADSVIWSAGPYVEPPSLDEMQQTLARIGRREVPAVRFGAEGQITVPVDDEVLQLEDLDALRNHANRLMGRMEVIPIPEDASP